MLLISYQFLTAVLLRRRWSALVRPELTQYAARRTLFGPKNCQVTARRSGVRALAFPAPRNVARRRPPAPIAPQISTTGARQPRPRKLLQSFERTTAQRGPYLDNEFSESGSTVNQTQLRKMPPDFPLIPPITPIGGGVVGRRSNRVIGLASTGVGTP
jgi:hypothetical protein